MSIQPPQGILNIPNATLRVGKLAVDSTAGFDTVFNNVERNTILLEDSTEYTETKQWDLKMPNIFVATFEIKGVGSSFNFRNTSNGDATTGYTLTFSGTTLTLKYDNASLTTATIPNLDSTYGKVYLTYEKQHFTVTVDGTLVLTYKDTGTRTFPDGEYANFFAGTGGGFKNLKVVAGHFISDGTSNIAYVGGGEVAVGKALAFNRVSNVSQIKVDSNVVTEYTGPHDRPLRKYPEVALTADAATASGYKGYKVTFSAQQDTSTRAAFRLFDHDTTDTNRWQSGSGTYNTSSPHAAILTNNLPRLTDVDGTNHDGQWVGLQLPVMIKLDHIKFTTYQAATRIYSPSNYVILGSNTGLDNSWNLLKEVTDQLYTTNKETVMVRVNAMNKYKYYVWLIKNLGSTTGTSSSTVIVPELEYYGYEEGSGSLDTTLKSVYNVPATTGTQLEVYYDGRETSSYSGSGTTVTDISPNTNNGTLNGGVGFDSTYKAFTFDGTDDYIEGTVTTGTGAWSHSIAFWFKIDQIPSVDVSVFQIKDSSVADNADAADHTSPHFIIRSDGTLNNAFMGNPGNFLDDNGNQLVVQTGVWQHYVVQYNASNGGTDYRDRKLIINGNKEYYPAAGTATALNMVASNKLFIGCLARSTGFDYLFNGSIANFRLYSKALNADQVKELYDYQKDYFLGSKSQVTLYKGHLGVGVTEPSGQLELAGDERIQEYPPRSLTNYDTNIPGHGVFKVYASTDFGQTPYRSWNAFDKTITTDGGNNGWASVVDSWLNDGTTTPVSSLAANFDGVECHWLALQLPYEVKPTLVTLQARNDGQVPGEVPAKGRIYGSKDGVTWNQIRSYDIRTEVGTLQASTDNAPIPITLTTNEYYTHLLLTVDERYGGSGTARWTGIGELRYFGTPGPTTLDKGSLSLTRSLDVPRVSRYDVDTETPRPEKLVVDFDTTVNSSPTDISGQGNHGTFYNGASYSPADKAFNFDGTDDYIKLDTGLTGNVVHSVSMWIKAKADLATGNVDVLFYWGGNGSGNHRVEVIIEDDKINYNFSNNNYEVTFPVNTLVDDRWYHLVFTYNGVGGASGREVYIDGVQQIGAHTGGSSAVLALADSNMYIAGNYAQSVGYFFSGLISNFRVYNVALEPSEVQKLYRLGRTGRSMVISDTAVGIGKVPEAQLDVRGNISCDGVVKPYTCAFSAYVSSGGNSSATDKFPADGVHFNIGNCYDASTYEFTAPVYGIYHMSWSAYTNEAATTTSRIFAHQSGNLIEQKGHTIEKHGNSLSLTVRMQAGETFYFRGTTSYPIYYYGADGHNRFSGHLICAL